MENNRYREEEQVLNEDNINTSDGENVGESGDANVDEKLTKKQYAAIAIVILGILMLSVTDA